MCYSEKFEVNKVHLESIVMLLESVLAPKIMSYDLYFAIKLMHFLFLVES